MRKLVILIARVARSEKFKRSPRSGNSVVLSALRRLKQAQRKSARRVGTRAVACAADAPRIVSISMLLMGSKTDEAFVSTSVAKV